MNHGKAEARSLALGLRSKERVEYFIDDVGRDSHACITDHEPQVGTGFHPLRFVQERDVMFDQLDVEGSPFLPHCMGGVADEVHDNLLHLGGIGEDET